MRYTSFLITLFALALSSLCPLPSSDKPNVPEGLKRFLVGDPPQASARITLPSDSKLFRKVLGQAAGAGRDAGESLPPPLVLGDLARNLSKALSDKGYAEQKWFVFSRFANELNGIAVMTRLERIDDAGKSIAENRFSQEPFSPDIKSLTDYFERLLVHGSKGQYRAFFIYLTIDEDDSPRQSGPPKVDSLNNAFVSGASGGPAFEEMNIDGSFSCTAYVYRFRRQTSDGKVEFVSNDALSGKDHLIAAGLWSQIGPE